METSEEIRLEARALSAALHAVETRGDAFEARVLCDVFLEKWTPDGSLEAKVIEVAVSKICRRPIQPQQISGSTELSTTSRRWVAWASGMTPGDPWFTEKGPSSFDALAIHQWSRAIDHLSEGNLEEGRIWFHRATRISSEYATESNALIHWAFAASFL